MRKSNTKIKILIADDHQVLRHGLISLFKEFDDFEVVAQAGNGREVLKHLEDYTVDIILLDVEMPVMNGNETLEVIAKKYPNINVIMFTMHDKLGYENHFLSSGAKAYLPKNTDFGIIIDTIHKVCDQEFKIPKTSSDYNKISDKHLRRALNEIEIQVLILACKDYNNVEISEALKITRYKAKYVRQNVHKKTCTKNLGELIIYAYKEGLIPLN